MTLGNGEGAVWDIDPESWKQRACAIANRTLTPEEWEEFLPSRPTTLPLQCMAATSVLVR